ncbi:MAG: S24 family peptidase [Treponema sp.]|nr:S24 family peptidase [Treponema sp.]
MEWGRIIDIIEEKSGKSICKELGIRSQYLSDLRSGKSKNPNSDFVLKLIEVFKLNPNWLLTGEGEMFQKSASELIKCNDEAGYKIPILNQKVSCGPGQNWESEQNVVEYFDIRAISPKLNAKDVYGFRVSGTSMLGAGIRDGDVVLFSTKEERLKDGIYVFGLDGDAYCKRLEFDSIANRIKIYSVRVADLEKAELIKTLNSTDEGFAERFMLFGRVFSWIHLVDGE